MDNRNKYWLMVAEGGYLNLSVPKEREEVNDPNAVVNVIKGARASRPYPAPPLPYLPPRV